MAVSLITEVHICDQLIKRSLRSSKNIHCLYSQTTIIKDKTGSLLKPHRYAGAYSSISLASALANQRYSGVLLSLIIELENLHGHLLFGLI